MTHDVAAWDAPPEYDDNAPFYYFGSEAKWPGAADHLADMMQLRLGHTLVDVGSGPGRLALLAAERVGASGRVIAIEPAAAMRAIARARVAERGLVNVEIKHGYMNDLPFEPDSFDAATFPLSIYFATDVPAVLREAARVVKPGGRIGISTCGDYFPRLGPEFIKIVNRLCPGLPTWAPWDDRTNNPAVLPHLFHAAGLPDVTVDTERIPVPLNDIDDAWAAIFRGTGWSKIVKGLGKRAANVRDTLGAFMQEHRITQDTLEVIYAVAVVPDA